MSHRSTIIMLLCTACLIGSSAFSVPPDELEPPVFDEYPLSIRASHCDDSVVYQFRARIPNQPHAQGRVRYRLVSGYGTINEKTGRWAWRPLSDGTPDIRTITVAAYINNTDIETPPEMYARLWVTYGDSPPKLVWSDSGGPRRPEIFHINAPGVTYLGYTIQERDWCDTPTVSIVGIDPAPYGTIHFNDTALVADLIAEDVGRKFAVTYEVAPSPFACQRVVVLDTRPPVVPVFVECPAETLFVPVCGEVSYQLRAVDPGFPDQSAGILYRMIEAGPSGGFVHPNTGEYRFVAKVQEAGAFFEVEVAAYYGDTMTTGDQSCRFWVQVGENHPPEFVGSTCGTAIVEPPDADSHFDITLDVVDPDSCLGSGLYLWLDRIYPSPAQGTGFGSWGYVQLDLQPYEYDQVFTIRVGATDGLDTAYCEFTYQHLGRERLEVAIEQTHMAFQGSHEQVDIIVNRNSFELQGFDFRIGYDAAALAFQGAFPGTIHDACGWEYFTYRYGASGNCNEECPSGLLRVVGIAETNNGEVHPICYSEETPFTLATMDFLVSSDLVYDCKFLPIRFLWLECDDNALAEYPSDGMPAQLRLLISREVYEVDSALIDATGLDSLVRITDPSASFPTFGGAPACPFDPDKPVPLRAVDFIGGGINTACADSITTTDCDPGSEFTPPFTAQASLYSNYFIYGRDVFAIPSYYDYCLDINTDGIYPSIEDLVYLLRVVTGDAEELTHPPDTASADFPLLSRTISVEPQEPLGAVLFVFAGNVVPTLLAENVDMRYAFDSVAAETRCLVASWRQGVAINEGRLLSLSYPAELRDVQAATYSGRPVHETAYFVTGIEEDSELLPTSFAVHQNHPNPFNLETVIPFDLPKEGTVRFEVFNVLGQMLFRTESEYAAGYHQILWDGRVENGATVTSGIYLYRITTGESSETKKMLLLK